MYYNPNHCTPVLMSEPLYSVLMSKPLYSCSHVQTIVLLFSCLNLCTLVQKAGAKVRFFAHTAK